MRSSPSVRAAIQIASVFAARLNIQTELAHLLYGVFSLEKLGQTNTAGSSQGGLRADIAAVRSAFDGHKVSISDARRRIRDLSKRSTEVNSLVGRSGSNWSKECRQAFSRAVHSFRQAGIREISLAPFTATVLESCGNASELLETSPEIVHAIVLSLGESTPAAPGISNSLGDEGDLEDPGVIHKFLDATQYLQTKELSTVGERCIALCELSWQAGPTAQMDLLLQNILEGLLKAIPAAEYGSVLILDKASNELTLRANWPRGRVVLSRSSAMLAVNERRSLIWQRGGDPTVSQLNLKIHSGIYAPVIADGQPLGVICLNARSEASDFTDGDLFVITFIGHQVGLVFGKHLLEHEVLDNAKLLGRLMTNFSPKVRELLLQRARSGNLRLGGQRSDVSIVYADFRGFTLLSAKMDPEDVVAMLNEYFSAFVACIFNRGGTIDKFMGDALLAVFGSPEKDPQHHENSVRAAVEMQRAAFEVTRRRKVAHEPTCDVGIGVHTGELIHGFVGSPERMEYTVIGDPVNMAARYCTGAGPGEVIISHELHQRTWWMVEVDPVEVGTKHEGVLQAFRVVSLKPES